MDNALIIDGVIAAALLAGIVIGAKRGLFRSLMGLTAVLAALIGAALLSNMLAPSVTEFVYPAVEDAVVSKLTPAVSLTGAADAILLRSLEDAGVDTEGIREMLSDAHGSTGTAYEDVLSAAARSLVESVVHAALLLLLFVVLLFVLRLLVRALDRVFDLPVLSTLNGLGGAVIGLAETALLLYAAVYIAVRLGASPLTEHADDTHLLPIFLGRSPVEWITSLTHLG